MEGEGSFRKFLSSRYSPLRSWIPGKELGFQRLIKEGLKYSHTLQDIPCSIYPGRFRVSYFT
jgi:hypothetical protein